MNKKGVNAHKNEKDEVNIDVWFKEFIDLDKAVIKAEQILPPSEFVQYSYFAENKDIEEEKFEDEAQQKVCQPL